MLHKRNILAIALILLLLAACTPAPSATVEIPEIPESMLLPFGENGKLIWKESELEETNITYINESTPGGYATISKLSDAKNAQKFVARMNKSQADLVGAVKGGLSIGDPVFPEFDLGSEVYFIQMSMPDQYHLISFYKAADCGYIWFRLNKNSDREVYFYSLYKIDMKNYKELEKLFESFEKQQDPLMGKPVIYLYPPNDMDVSVSLSFKGRLSVTYPEYNGGWNVLAHPDGRLIDRSDGAEYSYLFWEGFSDDPNWFDLDEGYCVAGADTAPFLRKTLGELGLTPKEYNEFIVYWLPQMQNNPYNLISFQWENYENIAPLTITPAPDSVLRVFMVFAPLENPVEIKPPAKREPFVRQGFSVVEWGAARAA